MMRLGLIRTRMARRVRQLGQRLHRRPSSLLDTLQMLSLSRRIVIDGHQLVASHLGDAVHRLLGLLSEFPYGAETGGLFISHATASSQECQSYHARPPALLCRFTAQEHRIAKTPVV